MEEASGAPGTSGPPDSAPTRRPSLDLAGRINFWSTAITALTAVIALVLSLLTYAQLNSSATIEIVMPKTVRFWAFENGLQLILGPTFSVNKKTELSPAVTDAEVRIEIEHQSITLNWYENVIITYGTRGAPVEFEADSAPFVITSGNSVTKYMQFRVTDSALRSGVSAGRWHARLTVKRSGQDDLTEYFCIDIGTASASFLSDRLSGRIAGDPHRLAFRTKSPLDGASNRCYESSDRIILPDSPEQFAPQSPVPELPVEAPPVEAPPVDEAPPEEPGEPGEAGKDG